jgi:hypothetical protein
MPAPRDTGVNRHGQRVLPHLARGEAPFEVVLLEEGFHRTRERLKRPFPKQDFLAVGEEDIGDVQFLDVGFGMFRRVAWTDRKPLGLDDGQGATVAVAKRIVGASGLEDVLEADAVLVVGVPALAFKLGVDDDAGKRLVAFRHAFAKSFVFLRTRPQAWLKPSLYIGFQCVLAHFFAF